MGIISTILTFTGVLMMVAPPCQTAFNPESRRWAFHNMPTVFAIMVCGFIVACIGAFV